jgi:hypothetical protein
MAVAVCAGSLAATIIERLYWDISWRIRNWKNPEHRASLETLLDSWDDGKKAKKRAKKAK